MRILQVALRAEDQERAAAFYTALLGRPPAARYGPLLFFRVGEVRLLFEEGVEPALIYLEVPELERALAALPQGTEVLQEPRRIFVHPDDALGPIRAEEWHAALRDPEGNTVVLVELRRP